MRTGLEPAPALLGPGIAVVVAGWVIVDTASLLSRTYLSWDVVSSTFHEVLWLAGAVIAAINGLYGAFFQGRRGSVHLARPRAGLPHLGVVAAALFGWSFLGLLVGMTPTLWRATSTATWGGLDPRDVLVATLGTALLALMGLVLGVALSHWLAAPAAAILAYLMGALPMAGALRPAALLQAVQQWPPTPQFHLSNLTTLFTANALIIGCAALLLAGASIFTSQRSSTRAAVLFGGVWVVLALTAFVWRPDFYTPRDATVTCEEGDVVVCVHPAHERSLKTVYDVSNQVTTTAPGLLDERRVLDAQTWPHQQRDDDLLVSVIFPDANPRNLYQSQDQALAADLTEELLVRPCSTATDPRWGDAHAVRAETLRRSGYPELADRIGEQGQSTIPLADLSDDAFAQLVTKNAESLRRCTGIVRG